MQSGRSARLRPLSWTICVIAACRFFTIHAFNCSFARLNDPVNEVNAIAVTPSLMNVFLNVDFNLGDLTLHSVCQTDFKPR